MDQILVNFIFKGFFKSNTSDKLELSEFIINEISKNKSIEQITDDLSYNSILQGYVNSSFKWQHYDPNEAEFNGLSLHWYKVKKLIITTPNYKVGNITYNFDYEITYEKHSGWNKLIHVFENEHHFIDLYKEEVNKFKPTKNVLALLKLESEVLKYPSYFSSCE